MSRYTAGLIGLGHIAGGYGAPGEEAPYCHAGGISQSESVELIAAADTSEPARAAFHEKWGPAFAAQQRPPALYADADAMLEQARPDIVGICVRGPLHHRVVRQVLQSAYRPRAIFLEKPPFCSLDQADEIIELAATHQIPITVSYSRHWAPHVLQLEAWVRDGLIGQVRNVVGYGAGPLLSFTSHTTDLICQFACAQGRAYDPIAVTASGLSVPDAEVPAAWRDEGYQAEPALAHIAMEFASGVTGTQIGARTEHGQFYVDVFGDGGHVRAGFDLAPAAWDKDGNAIDLSQRTVPAPASVFRIAYDQIAGHLSGGPLPACTDHNWHQVNEIGFAAIQSAQGQERLTLPLADRAMKVFANG